MTHMLVLKKARVSALRIWVGFMTHMLMLKKAMVCEGGAPGCKESGVTLDRDALNSCQRARTGPQKQHRLCLH